MTALRHLGARYVPPVLAGAVVIVFNVVTALLAFIRGADWLEVETPDAFSRILLGLDVPLRVWGLALVGSSCWFLAAMLLRRHLMVWIGHALLFAVYAGLAVDVARAVLEVGSGVYQLVPFVGGAFWHGFMAAMTRSHPRRAGAHLGGPRGQHAAQ